MLRAFLVVPVVGLGALGALACGTEESSSSNASGGTGGVASGGTAGTGGTSASGGGSGGGAGSGATGGTGTGATGGVAGSGGASSGPWSMGYYVTWQANQYPVSEIEWSGMTHVALAFYTPGANGSLSLMAGNSALAKSLVTAAHAKGVKAIASIGGADSANAFEQATASGSIAAFIANLVGLLNDPGFDGIDIDWEPLETADHAAAIQVANGIRAAKPNALVTIPIGYQNINIPGDLSGYAKLAAAYDQLNIMSYGMSGAWSGWKSWHSSPLYQQDSATPTSIDSTVKLYVAAGVPKSKLGIGIGFYGLCYTPPVTGPGQALGGSQIAADDGTMSYAHIMTQYFSANARKWDTAARVPYLSLGSAQGPEGCSYISYDDEQSIAEKGTYVKSEGLGGVIIWQINEGYMPSATQKNSLLVAVHDKVLN